MPLNKNYFLILFFFVLHLKAQNNVIQTSSFGKNRESLEAILQQEKSFDNDTTALKTYLNPLNKTSYYSVFYDALLANGYSNYYNKINPKSNFHYLQSRKKALLLKQPNIEIWTELNYVFYLYHHRNYVEMTPLLLKVIDDIKKLPAEKLLLPGESFKKIGWIVQTLGDYPEALHYLTLAKKYTPEKSADYAAIVYSIGFNYLSTSNLKKAESYFLQSAILAQEIGDEIRYAKVIGDLAIIKQKRGDLKTAISLLQKDITISKSQKSDQNTMYALIKLAELYVADKNYTDADQSLKEAQKIAVSKTYFEKSELQIIQLKLKILQQQNKTENELALRRRMLVLEDSLKNKDGDIAISKANWMIQKTKFQNNLKTTNEQYKHETSLKNIYGVIIILIFIVLIVLFFSFKKRLKIRNTEYNQKVTSLKIEKIKNEKKLSEVNENLNLKEEFLKDKNNQIKKLNAEIDKIKQSKPNEAEKGNLENLLDSHLMTESNWNNFKKEFQKEYPEFYRLLENDFPEITDSNKRILLLQKLNLKNNEIAELLGITPDAVKKSKQRLKKKLGDKSDLLFAHLQTNKTKPN